MATVDAATTKSSVISALNASSSSSSTSSATSSDDIQNRFLTMLVAQLENQDPLNPLDNTEITSQLSQMSTVQGIEQLNASMASLVNSLADTQSMQAASLIGNSVLVPGKNLTLTDGAAYGGINLASAADAVNVSVYDSSGNLVQTLSLGAADAGSTLFSWDGKTSSGTTATDGSYTFKVAATKGSTTVTSEAMQIGTVSALVRSTSGFQLDLGSLGTFGFADVEQVF